MEKVFISVSHKKDIDIDFAKKLKDFLEQNNFDVFLAKTSIEVGEIWADSIKKNIELCKYFIVLLSNESIMSEMVIEEVRLAKLEQGRRKNGFPIILPIHLNLDYDLNLNYDLSGYLNRIQYITWSTNNDTLFIFNKILTSIKKKSIIDNNTNLKKTNKIKKEIIEPINNAPLEYPEGQVRISSKYYIKRDIDNEALNHLKGEGALIRIKAPRQYGKTSLLSRLLYNTKKDHKIVSISFHLLDYQVLESLDGLLKFIAIKVIKKLKLKRNMIEEYWNDEYLGSKSKMMDLFEEYILESINEPIILALDEVDKVFPLDKISDDFFSLIRAMHEESKLNPIWEKIKIILVHSTEPQLGIKGIEQSPFYNVGFSANLSAFTNEEVKELSIRYKLELSNEDIEKLINFLGGHPFLTNKTLYYMAKENLNVDRILSESLEKQSIYNDHLRRYFLIIKENNKLSNALRKIILKEKCLFEKECQALKAAGIIKNDIDEVEFSCKLYKDFFTKYLIIG